MSTLQRASRVKAASAVVALLVLTGSLAGCSATRERAGHAGRVGLLARYSQLKENPDYPASLVYLNGGRMVESTTP
jgi:hypothetical protein